MELNEQQRALVDFELAGEGSVILEARAGTGKTHTLIQLLPFTNGSVFLGAYNKKIQLELEAKVNRLDSDVKRRVTVKTMHAAGLAAFSGYGSNRPKIEGNKMRLLLDHLAPNNEVFVKYRGFLLKLVSLAKLAGFGIDTPEFPKIDDTLEWEHLIDWYNVEDELRDGYADIPSLITVAKGLYVQSLELCRKPGGPFSKPHIDFDDMLLAPLYFNVKCPKYDRVLIDEAQDTSGVRRELAMRMLAEDGRLIAVGDPFQAIYGFTGADCDSLELIQKRTNAITLPLTMTYRCGKVIVAEAQRWVPDIVAHESSPDGKVSQCYLEPEKPEDPNFWDAGPWTYNDAILFGNTKPLITLAYQFIRKGIPAKVEGRDIGNGLKSLATKWKVTALNALEAKILVWRDKEIEKWKQKGNDRRVEETEDKADTIMVLIDATKDRGGYSVSDLLNLIDSMFADTEETGPKCLTLSTIHKSKGREWERVFILGMERYQPSKWAKQEWELKQETNLMYVAVTRAKRELVYVRVPATQKKPTNPAMATMTF